jgi:hypothetical protein
MADFRMYNNIFLPLYKKSVITNFFKHVVIQSGASISLAEMLQLMGR